MKVRLASPAVFIVGTDTGVGKTVATTFLLARFRSEGVAALAVKPFSTGDRDDASQLLAHNPPGFSLDEINPFHYSHPIAPWLAARAANQKVHLGDVLDFLQSIAKRCEILIIEGAGGLMTPLGENLSSLDLIQSTESPNAILVASNRLGAINQVRLGLEPLRFLPHRQITVLLSRHLPPDASTETNLAALAELLTPIPVLELPWLGQSPPESGGDQAAKSVFDNTFRCLNDRFLSRPVQGVPGTDQKGIRESSVQRNNHQTLLTSAGNSIL